METPDNRYDLAGRVIGLAMRVHRELGPGFVEKVYHNALDIEFENNGLEFEREKAITVYYRNTVVGQFAADFLVEENGTQLLVD